MPQPVLLAIRRREDGEGLRLRDGAADPKQPAEGEDMPELGPSGWKLVSILLGAGGHIFVPK